MIKGSTSHGYFGIRSLAPWPLFLALIFASCSTGKPCETTRQCSAGDVCAASLCQELSCGQSVFLRDPETARCVPLPGCFLTDEQRDWASCDEGDPCGALVETACLSDARCQPIYALDRSGDAVNRTCRVVQLPLPMGSSVANQHRALHPPMTCTEAAQRVYAGCRIVPEPTEPCSALDQPTCATRPDCDWGKVSRASILGALPACVDRRELRSPDCNLQSEVACLLNPRCQVTGTACYCPPGATCPCSGGKFVACEHNDRLIRCASDGDCGSGQTCRARSDCPSTRTGLITASPYSAPCLGVCASDSCEGLDEASCADREGCSAVYGTECTGSSLSPYEDCPLNPAGSVVDGCVCDNVFQRCAVLAPIIENGVSIRSERSLLIRDPSIVSDEAFSIDKVLSSFAKPGDEQKFIERWIAQFYSPQTLPSGATAPARSHFSEIFRGNAGSGSLPWLGGRFHTTALINRLDLMRPGTCGEARISFAYNGGYFESNTRMTLIVELKVPDDGQGCKQAAAQWIELSAIDDPSERLARLKTLYGALLRPQHLSQVRTNEFINPLRQVSWELREWHLFGEELRLAPARQAVDMRVSGTPELASWAASNVEAINKGTIEVPHHLQAAAVTADGRMLRVPGSRRDATLRGAEAALNKLSCGGCHLGATGSPFVHIGERLADAKVLKPVGRAVVSQFLLSELPKRAATLTAVWQGRASLQSMHRASSLRVH